MRPVDKRASFYYAAAFLCPVQTSYEHDIMAEAPPANPVTVFPGEVGDRMTRMTGAGYRVTLSRLPTILTGFVLLKA